ncbi:MAG: hypothetical protein JNN03_10595 [Rubrivivax sp.]|nr:hypothetical protein [Rubrivivax sp.]
MSIEWGGLPFTSNMSASVVDLGQAPADVLVANQPCRIDLQWDVPAPIAALINAGHQFRLRAYAESIGPGQEKQLGGTDFVPGVPGQLNYSHSMNVAAGSLLGEGQVDPSGQPVSGLYKVACVLQLMNGGATRISGFGEYTRHVMFRAP